MQLWKTRSRHTVLRPNDGKFLTVENHTVELPDGRIIADWPWLITPDYVNVVAVTTNQEFICFRQTKYAVADVSLAIVGGYLEPEEEPLAAAQRELLEETGYQAPTWRNLGSYVVDGNRGAGVAHLFLALHAAWMQPIQADDLEEQQLLLLQRHQVDAALAAGEFRVLPWAAAVALALVQMQP